MIPCSRISSGPSPAAWKPTLWPCSSISSYGPSGSPPLGHGGVRFGHWICTPEIARLITSRWISEVPSKIVQILASRCIRSTGNSRL